MTGTRTATKRFMFMITYNGPFERATNLLLGIRERPLRRVREVPDDSLRAYLANITEALDRRWRNRHLRRGTTPWKVCKRAR